MPDNPIAPWGASLVDSPTDLLERLLVERACERLITGFVHRLDLGAPASVAELFTEDGHWFLATRTLHLPFGGTSLAPSSVGSRSTPR